MIILSIETSCDETGITILEVKVSKNPVFSILANGLASQIEIHKEYGGVFPALAKREHIKNLPIVLEKVLKKSKIKLEHIDAIAVTYGPGLEPALWTGIVFAKELAQKYQKPLIPVNHMEGHLFSVFGKDKGKFEIPKIKFPVLSLLVSGGHTELVVAKDWMKYKVIGETLDDAAGEAFDKVARMLELPYPGGPEISKLAEQARKSANLAYNIRLPRPMMYTKNFDFSFSGLKTAVLYLVRDLKKENPNIFKDGKLKMEIALEFQNAVTETLVCKTKKAVEKYAVKTLIVAGGVAADKHLREEVKNTFKGIEVLFPDRKLSTDNSIMIGIVGAMHYIKNPKIWKTNPKIKAEGNLKL